MDIIKTKCWVQKPNGGYYRDCFAIFGAEYKSMLFLIAMSLIIGFGYYYFYSLMRKDKFEVKNFLIKSLLLSLIALFIILVILGLLSNNIIV